VAGCAASPSHAPPRAILERRRGRRELEPRPHAVLDERVGRLGVIEATFEPLPIDAAVAREWGRLSAAVASRDGQPRRRVVDPAIAATANVHGVPLVTRDADVLRSIGDLVDLRPPGR
jgi:predicted nucleic acid-binding protein